jgi:hypothetical protein
MLGCWLIRSLWKFQFTVPFGCLGRINNAVIIREAVCLPLCLG